MIFLRVIFLHHFWLCLFDHTTRIPYNRAEKHVLKRISNELLLHANRHLRFTRFATTTIFTAACSGLSDLATIIGWNIPRKARRTLGLLLKRMSIRLHRLAIYFNQFLTTLDLCHFLPSRIAYRQKGRLSPQRRHPNITQAPRRVSGVHTEGGERLFLHEAL